MPQKSAQTVMNVHLLDTSFRSSVDLMPKQYTKINVKLPNKHKQHYMLYTLSFVQQLKLKCCIKIISAYKSDDYIIIILHNIQAVSTIIRFDTFVCEFVRFISD
jgi:hypothetical protein